MAFKNQIAVQALVALSFIARPAGLLAQVPKANEIVSNDRAVTAIVDHAVDSFFKNTPQAVGLSIGVVKADKTYTYNYGTVERGKKVPPTANTLYPIASITKTFTGALLAQAALEGKIKLDDNVGKYLDGDYPNLGFQAHPIRLFDLLRSSFRVAFIYTEPARNPAGLREQCGSVADADSQYREKLYQAELL